MRAARNSVTVMRRESANCYYTKELNKTPSKIMRSRGFITIISKACFVVYITCLLIILSGSQAKAQPPLPDSGDHHDHMESSKPAGHRRDHDNGSAEHTVILTVPVIVLSMSVIIITLVVVYVVHKSRYGEFCCMKPYRSRRHRLPALDDDTDVHPVVRMLPPEYDTSYLQKESPPVYCDALQDRVLVSGTVALPPYNQIIHTDHDSHGSTTDNHDDTQEEDQEHETVIVHVVIDENHVPQPTVEAEEDTQDSDESSNGESQQATLNGHETNSDSPLLTTRSSS